MLNQLNVKIKILAIFSFFFTLCSNTFALEPIYLQILINGEKKGDYLLYIDKDVFYIKISDLKIIGIKQVIGTTIKIQEEEFVSLNDMKGIENIKFDEISTSLLLEISPYLLEKNIIDFSSKRSVKVVYPEREKSIFLNYRLDYTGRDSFSYKSFNLANELGINFNNLLFLTETRYEKNNYQSNFIRLQTSIYKDDRKNMTRLILGDFITPSDAFSGGINIGGISYSKNFKLDPYFVYRPTLSLKGAVKNKSTLEVYLDGVPIRRESISPGEFELKDIYYYHGQRELEIVIKDSFGRIEREIYPFYFTDTLLKKGISEFSYNLGFVRKNYGSKSNEYESLILNLYHKYGYNDRINIGLSSEFYEKSFFISPDISYFKPNFGVISFKGYLNKNKESNGINYALLTNYNFQKKNINYGLNFRYITKDFKTSSYDNKSSQKNYEIQGKIGYFSQYYGSFNVDLIHRKLLNNLDENELLFGYSKSLFTNTSIYLNLRKGISGTNLLEAFLGLSYHFDKKSSISFIHRESDSFDSDKLQLTKNAPLGEGYGYRIGIENLRGQGRNVNQISPFYEYRTSHNIFTADINFQEEQGKTTDSLSFSVAGAVLLLNGKIGFTRPVNDSFALIKADKISNLPIYFNNEEIAKTNKEGIAFIPTLNSYSDNILEIPAKKIPLQYSLLKDKIVISPSYRYGTCINFPIKKVYRYEGVIKIFDGNEVKPLSFKEIHFKKLEDKLEVEQINSCNSPIGDIKDKIAGTFFTSVDGDFYLENITPGRYILTFNLDNKNYNYEIEFPDGDSVLLNLGEIIIKKMMD